MSPSARMHTARKTIASGVEEAMELFKGDIGYKEYTVFVERKPVQVPIE